MIGFTGSPLDRADHLRLDPVGLAALTERQDARLLRLAGLDPVLDPDGGLQWDAMDALGPDAQLIFLGLLGEAPLFAPVTLSQKGGRAWSIFGLLSLMAPADASLWGTARSLIEWHNRHGFCANCGTSTAMFRGGWGRQCPGCKADHFPRVDPVVIMLAEHDGRVLLGRQPQYPPGRYSALAGFVEPGESIEEAVMRELAEEAGIRAGNIRYVASQPWPFPGQLMIACLAEAESEAITIDPSELEDAIWVDADGVRAALAGAAGAPFLAPPPYAIAHSLLTRWIAGLDRLAAGGAAA